MDTGEVPQHKVLPPSPAVTHKTSASFIASETSELGPPVASFARAMRITGHEPGLRLQQCWAVGSAGGIKAWKEIIARSLAGTLHVAAERCQRALKGLSLKRDMNDS